MAANAAQPPLHTAPMFCSTENEVLGETVWEGKNRVYSVRESLPSLFYGRGASSAGFKKIGTTRYGTGELEKRLHCTSENMGKTG